MVKVAVARKEHKVEALNDVLEKSQFDTTLQSVFEKSGKTDKSAFSIVIKPNMMVFSNLTEYRTVTTDVELMECLMQHIRSLGFTNIKVVEAQNVLALWLNGHTVKRVAKLSGYSNNGYEVVDLTEESVDTNYRWRDAKGKETVWKHPVGKSWRDADFRISFAKCKSHESDYMTLTVKNVYGCFPARDKHQQYHMQREVPDVTASSVWTFPIHFGLIDAFVASDGYQGYKTQKYPKELKMMFGSSDAVCADLECTKRAGIHGTKLNIIRKYLEWARDGKYPEYEVVGDQSTMFTDIIPHWQNISDEIVQLQNFTEESLVVSGVLNVNAVDYIDFHLFPPRNLSWRIGLIFMRLLNSIRWLINKLAGKRIW
ncbi:MAG: DUF362 domain-containing protein [Ignavibacteriae bacterium]|nr:DUF362 domain-containing protein [Ignavibacteriota bacterium]